MIRSIALATFVLSGCAITNEDASSAAYPLGPYAIERDAVLPDLAAPGIDPARGRMEVKISSVRASLPECRCLIVHVGRAGSDRTLVARAQLRDLRLSDPTMCAVEVLAERSPGVPAAVVDLPAPGEAVAPTMLAPEVVRASMADRYPEGFDLAIRTDAMRVRAVSTGALDLATVREACGTWPRRPSDG